MDGLRLDWGEGVIDVELGFPLRRKIGSHRLSTDTRSQRYGEHLFNLPPKMHICNGYWVLGKDQIGSD